MKQLLPKSFKARVLAGYVQSVLACPATPIEVMRRAIALGPFVTKATSHAAQWAGRTTLSSGSATVTVSTRAVNSDSLILPNVLVALAAAYTTQGLASIASGSTTVTQSTTAAFSGQVFTLAFANATNQASGQSRGFRVDSIVDGTSFALATADGQSMTGGTANLMWRIPQAVPEGMRVSTISPGNFFTLGWADGQARPVDVTVLWEMRKTS